MDTSTIKGMNDEHIINTYGERQLALVRGEGARLWDAEGREYLDFFSGIATASLGHCHPAVTEALCIQAKTLVHVSNLYYIEPQVRLAEKLSAICFADRWFFGNDGAGANEAAIKLARRYWVEKGTPKPGLIAAHNSFHGRTLATITATGQAKYKQGFDPLMPGITHVPYNDVDALAAAITDETGAVLLEPVQGEGGVNVPADDYLKKVRALCDDKQVLLILDEVQTGLCRTGKYFAYEHSGAAPDIITLAKALGNGVPIGAMGCTNEVASGFSVGSHATTFGGNPLCSAVACAVLDVMTAPGFVEGVAEKGAYFSEKLNAIAGRHAGVKEVRGKGLMIGVELDGEVKTAVEGMLARGIICGPAGPNVIRFVPPLIIDKPEIDRAADALDAVLGEVASCTI